MKKQCFVTNEYYHVYNRGVDKRDIFISKKDINRFTESMLEFNQINTIGSLANLRKREVGLKALSRKPLVAIISYCLNPNHFHLILKQLTDGGISKFMQKLQSGYTSYFNLKNSRSGSLFQGTFKSCIINDENYFNKIIAYVNKNYKIHNIPENKMSIVLASDHEYENNNFKIVSKKEGEEILKIFKGIEPFKKHCDEIIEIIKEERGGISLVEDEPLPDTDRA